MRCNMRFKAICVAFAWLLPLCLFTIAMAEEKDEQSSERSETVKQEEHSSDASIPAKVGERAPDFELTTVDGKKVKLSQVLRKRETKVVLLEFMSIHCPYSNAQIPLIRDIFKARRKDGLMVLGIVKEANEPSAVKRYAERQKLKFPLLLDAGTKVFKQLYDVPSTPTVFIVSKDGKVLGKYVGQIGEDREEYRRFINDVVTAVIQGKPLPSPPQKVRSGG